MRTLMHTGWMSSPDCLFLKNCTVVQMTDFVGSLNLVTDVETSLRATHRPYSSLNASSLGRGHART